MSLSRRQFIQASGIALCAGAVPLKASAAGQQQPLPVPPLLESRRGQPLFMTVQRAHWSFTPGTRASVWGINGRYLGPTIRVWKGDDVKLIYSNRLTENVSMTVAGLQVPGPLMGGPARMMSPNADWAPVLPIRQNAATLWYHANTPNRTAQQVYNGLAGMWLVEDEVSKSLPIPNHYGVDDFPVIIQDKRLDNFGTPEYNEPGSGGFVGDTLLVNGVQSPYVEVSRGWVRLRLLNASNSRRYQLQMSDGRPLHVISGDQGFLPAPVSVKQLSLAPGERREILVDMSNGDEVSITCGEAASIVDRIRGFFEPSSILVSTLVLTLRPTGLLPLVTDSLPALALGVEPVDPDIMKKPPTDAKKSLFAGGMAYNIAIEGCLIGAISLLAFTIGRVYFDVAVGRTMAFAVLSLSQLVHAFNVRSERSLFTMGLFSNTKMLLSFVVCLGLQVSVISIPVLSAVFKTACLSGPQWLTVAALSLAPLVVVELEKWYARYRKKRQQRE